MNTLVIDFGTDGNARCLWTDELPLASLGHVRVERASNVEFNEATCLWEVRLADAPEVVAYANKSRSECIRWEIDTLNRRLLGRQ